MTWLTDITGIDVRQAFTDDDDIVVTGETGFSRRRMVKDRYYPRRGGMTNLAGFTGGNMRDRILARRNNSIVTRGAGAIHLGVINNGNRLPARDCMTGTTLITGINMRNRIFTGSNGTVMTAFTGTQSLVVIYRANRHPGSNRVAGLAHLRGRNVVCAFADRPGVVMAD